MISSKRNSGYPPNSIWDNCNHIWKEYGDYELGGNRVEVQCVICKVPGELDEDINEVYWPTT